MTDTEKTASKTIADWKETFDKEMKAEIKALSKGYDIVKEVLDSEEILIKEVKRFGGEYGHVTGISKDHIGKKVKIIIPKSKEESKEEDTPKES